MHRLLFPLLLLCVPSAFGQQAATQLVNRPVLKALPLEFEEKVPSKPSQALVPEPVVMPSPIDAKPVGDDAVRLQIFLDEASFGPGVIDGKPGRFTELAARSWNEVNGHPVDDWTAVNTAARKAVQNPFAVAVVPDAAAKWVDPELPTSREGQAKKNRMSYRSYGEFMAERYHCDAIYLAELNTWQKINSLKPHDSIIVPNVAPFDIEKLTGAKYEADEALSQRHVVVDTKINQVRIFEAAPAALVVAEPGVEEVKPVTRANRGLVASFPITPGKPQFIKFGTWELRNMVELPWWRYDQQLLDTGKRSANALNIPPGPNSPVGVIWNGTSKPGIGMHGTSDPETIGRARSAGCIRLANWDAIRLPTLIRPGATVEIR
jgi:lipoprotein-anchoring transpeptidase ErfK/SrfK